MQFKEITGLEEKARTTFLGLDYLGVEKHLDYFTELGLILLYN